MKAAFCGAILAATFLSACNSSTETQTTGTNKAAAPAAPAAPAVAAPYTPPAGVDAKVSASLKPVIDGYLRLKNALAADKGADAAAAGKAITEVLASVDTAAMTAQQKGVYAGLVDDIREHAEHIGKAGGDIGHQREHFETLSKDVYDLSKTFGGSQKLYYTHCPMAFDNKGASWLSEFEEIKNPYFGGEMLECGEVKEELK